jgi:hypothetical protein
MSTPRRHLQKIKNSKACVGTCKPFYFGFPEDGVLALKHVEILCVMYAL